MSVRAILQLPGAWLLLSALALLALVGFGVISLATNIGVAIGVTILVVGLVLFFQPRVNPMISVGLVASGALLAISGDTLSSLSVASALNLGGQP